MNWAVVVNPNSGSRKGERDWPVIKKLLSDQGLIFESSFTSHKGHAVSLTRELLSQGYRKFISVGGDGLLNEIANGILTQTEIPSDEITLGMIPVGTGNDWCRTTAIPMDYSGAIAILKREQCILHDAGNISFIQNGRTESRYFVNMAGIGFDAEVAAKINSKKSTGSGKKESYLFELATTLFTYRSTMIRLVYHKANDEPGTFAGNVFSASLCIGKYNGGGMLQAPDARVDDGLFHVTIIKRLSPFSVILHIKKLYNGRIEKHPKVEIITTERLEIHSEPRVRIEADGESLGYSPFEISILKKKLKMVVGDIVA